MRRDGGLQNDRPRPTLREVRIAQSRSGCVTADACGLRGVLIALVTRMQTARLRSQATAPNRDEVAKGFERRNSGRFAAEVFVRATSSGNILHHHFPDIAP